MAITSMVNLGSAIKLVAAALAKWVPEQIGQKSILWVMLVLQLRLMAPYGPGGISLVRKVRVIMYDAAVLFK